MRGGVIKDSEEKKGREGFKRSETVHKKKIYLGFKLGFFFFFLWAAKLIYRYYFSFIWKRIN